jgi:hypothetical protein
MSDYISQMRARGKFPAVLRYERMGPEELRKMIKHARPEVRKNLRHVDGSRTHLNRTTIGELADLEQIFETTDQMAKHNLASNLVGLKKLSKGPEREQRKARGLVDPWDAKALPWRQAIMTVHHEWALAPDDCPAEHIFEFLGGDGELVRLDKRKCLELEAACDEFMREQHGDALLYARWDWDEQGPHGHYGIAHMAEHEPTGRYAMGRFMWQPSLHPHFRNETNSQGQKTRSGYEIAQDQVGAFFSHEKYAHMNIVRGEPRAAKCRDAERAADDLVAEAEFDALLGEREAVPEGSKHAKAMAILKQKMSEAVAEKGGDASKIRKDPAQKLALEYLEELGVVSSNERHEASTRRARMELLERHQDLVGTPHEIVADPEATAQKVVARARAERAAADRRRQEAEAAERRAIQAEERLDAERRAEAERRAREDAARKERHRQEDEAREAKAADLEAREKNVAVREAEISRKSKLLGRAVDQAYSLVEKVKNFARKIGMRDEILDRDEFDAIQRMRDTLGVVGGKPLQQDQPERQRTRDGD